MSAMTTLINAIISTLLVAVLYNAARPILVKTGALQLA